MFHETIERVAEQLATNIKQGLTPDEAARRLKKDGLNELTTVRPTSWFRRFVGQFCSMMIGLLIVSAIIAGIVGDWIDTVAILAIVVLNAALGFFQEERAEQAMAALKHLSSPRAKVQRGGETLSVDATELVVGDLIHLESGDRMPADARIAESFGLQTQESSLTGESTPVSKNANIQLPLDTPLADRVNCLFAGTSIATGKATAVVIATGMNTEIGSIARLLQSAVAEQTPLQRRLTELGKSLVAICLVLVLIIFILQWVRGGRFTDVLLTSISLAVAAIPEGLPAVVTVTLAIGLQRMAKRNALIRKLPSVETLGCVTVICSDKTGTLTRNEMTVREMWINNQIWLVGGEGYAAEGSITPDPKGDSAKSADAPWPRALTELITYGDACNNSRWQTDAPEGNAAILGDPTEIALKVLAAKAKLAPSRPRDNLVHENPFDSDRKLMSQVFRESESRCLLIAKGAPEVILAKSTKVLHGDAESALNHDVWEEVVRRNTQMASQSLRVLAIAFREAKQDQEDWKMESELTFVGLIGMIDPPRLEAFDAVARCKQAGIRPVMITGDHPQTALAIATTIGIADKDTAVLVGTAIDQMSDAELIDYVPKCSVVARVSAQHKLRVVNAWKSNAQIVAMTGDGVNDAPAVQAADIGIVMGITGTDVAKEAADMVLTDDNFVSIVNAIEEGRGIYENIRKFLQFLLACNSSEVLFMFTATLLGWPSPLLAIQILWINLVTDGLPALALASEPLSKGLMTRPPRRVDQPILSWENGRTMLFHGVLMAGVTLFGFWWMNSGSSAQLDRSRAVAFCILTFTQIFYSMACRDFNTIMPKLGFFSNPLLVLAMVGSIAVQFAAIACPWSARILGLDALHWGDMPFLLVLSILPVTIVELEKILRPYYAPSPD